MGAQIRFSLLSGNIANNGVIFPILDKQTGKPRVNKNGEEMAVYKFRLAVNDGPKAADGSKADASFHDCSLFGTKRIATLLKYTTMGSELTVMGKPEQGGEKDPKTGVWKSWASTNIDRFYFGNRARNHENDTTRSFEMWVPGKGLVKHEMKLAERPTQTQRAGTADAGVLSALGLGEDTSSAPETGGADEAVQGILGIVG